MRASVRALASPLCFHKNSQTALEILEKPGHPYCHLLDDGLGGRASLVQARINSLTVHADLPKSGFVLNEDKSLWEPVQIIAWLGVHLNTLDGTIRAMDEGIAKLSHDLAALSSYKSSSAVHVKRIANVAGQIISLSSCVESVARIMT